MCGIAGIIYKKVKDSRDKKARVKSMLQSIEHRGPDSYGIWSTKGFAFGMRRLSIIDLEGSDQPIWADNGVGIIFNGEIYNFKKLRAQLEAEGIQFKTHGDTEVILQLYLQKGLKAVQDLEGMFAICIYDPCANKVLLIRDRLGVKPLYYYVDENQFVFGSEIKAILKGLSHKPSINHQAIWDYLTLRYVPSPETIWQQILKLEPAHYGEFNLITSQFTLHRYWNMQFEASKPVIQKDYEKEFEILFMEAVEKRLLAADVPVGILLSGGLDSSAVAAAAVELGHKNFHTFSIGFEDGKEFSELNFAKKVADHLGSNHHEIVLTQQQFLDFIPEFVYYTDEPLADLASIPLYYVSKLAREHVKVVLSGEGADEILAGYHMDTLAHKLNQLKWLSYLPRSILKHLPYGATKILAEYGYSHFLKSQATHITRIFDEEEKKDLCVFAPMQSTVDKIQQWYDLTSSTEPLDQLQQVYCHSWLVEDLLMKADKMTMATSLELRVPFLDHKLVEWATQLPLEWKVGNRSSGYTTKRILRRFAEKRLPLEIIQRPKQGFPVPAYQWVQRDLLKWAQAALQTSSIYQYCKVAEIERILQKAQTGSLQAAHQVWSLIILGEWLNRWEV